MITEWKQINFDWVFSSDDFVFRLHRQKIGIYGMGVAYVLQVRKRTETKFEHVGYSFWIKSDGGHESYKENSVYGELWECIKAIQIKSIQILLDLCYLEN